MIDQSLFPDDWHQSSPPRERSAPIRWGTEKLGVGFITMRHGVAGQVVHRGRNIDETEAAYRDRVGEYSWFHSDEDETEWYIPPDFNYESSIADRYRFGCQTHKPSGVQSCQLAAQYEVYLTQFRTDMSPVMTYNDLERILQTIDDKMAQCFDK